MRCRIRSSSRCLALHEFVLRARESFDHLIEAVAEKLDFVPCAADLNRFQPAFAHGLNALMQQAQRAAQQTDRHSRCGAGNQ